MVRDTRATVALGLEPTGEPLTHQVLGTRLYLHTIVRAGGAVTLVGAALIGRHLVGIADLPVRAFALLAGVILAYNVVIWLLVAGIRGEGGAVVRYRRLQGLMHATIALDFLALTVVIWLMGGARSPLLAFYLLHVILSATLLSPREAAISSVMAYALLSGLVIGEWAGIIPVRQLDGITDGTVLEGRYAALLLTAYGLLFGVTTILLVSLSRALQSGEARIRAAVVALRKVSDLRRDFLHIAVHNMGSPVGAVTMFLRNLKEGLAGPLNEKQEGWVDRALARLDGLSRFLSDLRILATLEAGRFEEEMCDLDVTPVLRELVDEYREVAAARRQALSLDAPPAGLTVRGNERLIREAVVNYITNALKFTPDGGSIRVVGERTEDAVRVTVIDDGPGIQTEDQSRLFAEFQKLTPPADGTPPGSGLGLSIVKRVAEAHGGAVGVTSRPGEGSRFYLELPAITVRARPNGPSES